MKNLLIYTLIHFNPLLNHFSEILLVVSLLSILSGILLLLSWGLIKYINRNKSILPYNIVNVSQPSAGKYGNNVNKKSDYDYDDCCCGGSCNCSCNHRLGGGIRQPRVSDVPLAWGLYFQDGASPSFEGIVELHNRIMFYLIVILFGVSWIISSILIHFNKSKNKLVYKHLNHGNYVPIQ